MRLFISQRRSRWQKYGLTHLPVLAGLWLLSGCYATTNIGNDEINYQASPASLANGKALYQSYCLECHGADLTGNGPRAAELENQPADLTAKTLHFSSTGIKGVLDYPHYSHETLQDRIKHGNSTMPPLDELLSRAEINDLTNYISAEIRSE